MAGRNRDGQAVLKVLGRLVFEGNLKLEDAEVNSFFAQHQVTLNDYKMLSGNWKNHKGFCVGWKLSLKQVYTTPFWITWRGDTQNTFIPISNKQTNFLLVLLILNTG